MIPASRFDRGRRTDHPSKEKRRRFITGGVSIFNCRGSRQADQAL